MKHCIKIHVLKVISIVAMLMVTSEAVCSASSLPRLMAQIEKRKADPNTKIVMRGLDLRDANLIGIDLSNTTLRDVNLRGANLTGANLSGSYLQANLTNANLTNADFTGAKLDLIMMNTNLTGANFANTKGLVLHQRNYARQQGAINVPEKME